MKREQLESLELEKEIIDKVMSFHGNTIENIKKTSKDLQEKLEIANRKIEELQRIDIEAIKKDALNHEKTAKDLQEKLEDIEYDSAIKDHVTGLKFSSRAAKKEFITKIKEQKLTKDGGKLIGFTEVVEKIKADEPDLFKESGEVVQKIDMGKTIALQGNQEDKLSQAFSTLLKER